MFRMNARAKIVSMVDDGLLDWEMVAREWLERMSCDEVQEMIDENNWEGPQV